MYTGTLYVLLSGRENPGFLPPANSSRPNGLLDPLGSSIPAVMAFSAESRRLRSHIFALIFRLLNFVTGNKDNVSYPCVAFSSSLLQLESGESETWNTVAMVGYPSTMLSYFSSLYS